MSRFSDIGILLALAAFVAWWQGQQQQPSDDVADVATTAVSVTDEVDDTSSDDASTFAPPSEVDFATMEFAQYGQIHDCSLIPPGTVIIHDCGYHAAWAIPCVIQGY